MLSAETMQWCLQRLEAFANVTGFQWSEGLAEMYSEALDEMTDRVAHDLVRTATMQKAALPLPAALRWMAGKAGETKQPAPEGGSTPYLGMDSGRPASDIVLEGYLAAWERAHPGQEPEGEWRERARRVATGRMADADGGAR